MSTKAKSKPGSATSPAPGSPDEISGEDVAADAARPRAGKAEAVTVYLASDRGRRASWMIGGLVVGALLLWKFGTVAAGIGVVLLLLGLYHTWFFVQTLRHDPGAVVVDARQIALPTGLCRGEPERVELSALGAAYFLRQAVPWNRSAPVLVIEAQGRAFVYPRDWFASEADQRRIMHAVLPLVAANSGATTAPSSSGATDAADANDSSDSKDAAAGDARRVAAAE
jgi:hypothetical protein